MTKGDSGRVVIEIEPDLKRRLYSTLAMESSTLKDWFIQCAESYVKAKAARQSDDKDQKAGPRP
jgi:predicted transcriptional regulator